MSIGYFEQFWPNLLLKTLSLIFFVNKIVNFLKVVSLIVC
jgi:hypothetical protein